MKNNYHFNSFNALGQKYIHIHLYHYVCDKTKSMLCTQSLIADHHTVHQVISNYYLPDCYFVLFPRIFSQHKRAVWARTMGQTRLSAGYRQTSNNILIDFSTKYSRIFHLYSYGQHYSRKKPGRAWGKPTAICRLPTDLQA